jgi:hypothetical protein
MSNIDTSNIDTAYPVAGQDNDSQGFRTNFASIASGLEIAKTEIAELQSKSIFKDALVDSEGLDNNLGGNLISNGSYKQLHPVFGNRGITSASSNDNLIDLNNGPVQKFTLRDADGSGSGDNFTWANWPSSNNNVCSSVRLIFTADTGTQNVTFGGNVIYATGFPSPLTVSSTKIKVVEAWSIDGGNDIYMHYIGEF